MANITHRTQPATADGPIVEPKEQVRVAEVQRPSVTGRPSVGQWLKQHWLDILTMAIMGAIGLGVYFCPPAPSRSFPIYNLDGNVADPQFAYPLRHEIIPIWAVTVLASLVPLLAFLFMQIRVRSFWDFNNAVLGLLYSLISAAVFQVFIKWLIGGLRPHFLAVCNPDLSRETGNGFKNIMHTRKVCKNPDQRAINDALESFPSGHTTAAFAGFVFLYLYLNAKFKVFSDYRARYWKLILLYMPILGAVLIGGALTIDEYHNWWDILAGAIIGTMMALSAYRMVYASIWNYRFNHIPLLPQEPLNADVASRDGVWTRKAGWGAPGAASLSSGPRSAANGVHMV